MAAKPVVYISGPMTGLPENNYPAFNVAAVRLRALGFSVENPAECEQQESWQSYMRAAIVKMMRADALIMLPGWEQSRGARIEFDLAASLSIPIFLPDDFVALEREDAAYEVSNVHPD